jgi:hypothetical protein
MAGAELHDVAALSELRSAFIQFRDRTRAIPDLLRLQTSRAQQRLGERRRALEARIEELEALAREDEDDGSSDRGFSSHDQLERLYRQLEDVNACAARLDTAASEHDVALGRWQHLTERIVPSAVAFLSTKHFEANEALAVAMPASGATANGGVFESEGTASVAGPATSRPESDPVHATAADELPALPTGFAWAPIAQMNLAELPGPDDFRKGVSYPEMSDGLQRLWKELMPLLGDAPDGGRTACERFDQANGRIDPKGFAHPASLASLWGHFFDRRLSRDYIRLEVDAAGKWHVVNGRHRIAVALGLGWKFIPAEVKDESDRAGGR